MFDCFGGSNAQVNEFIYFSHKLNVLSEWRPFAGQMKCFAAQYKQLKRCLKNVLKQLRTVVLDATICLYLSCMFSLPSLASPAAGHITSNDQLTAYLTSAFGSGPHTVLLFLQDKVSPWGMKTTLLLCSKHGNRMSPNILELRMKSVHVERRLWGFHRFHCSSIRRLVLGYVV